ncbi:hypothetical protein GAY28_03700 [Azospirillum brasilense]|nr:hypothetical protein [Azospirillum brasilense]
MGHVAAWLGRPRTKGGLDNLGTQQPCIYVYGAALPGITNVTDRAFYYGFYPWFIRTFEKRHPDATNADFVSALRRADCLMTLIAYRHAVVCKDDGRDDARHGFGCPGRQRLVPAARSLDETGVIHLSEYAILVEGEKRYFKNSLGGLGQYYLGMLRDEFHVLAGDGATGVKYTKELGLPTAIEYGDGLDEDGFFGTLDADAVTLKTLDGLSGFCPCRISDGQREKARARLLKMLLAEDETWRRRGQNRRLTLGLALHFLDAANGAKTDDTTKSFLAGCYAGSLTDGTTWEVPEPLGEVRRLWALYLRNELLSLAFEAVFQAALSVIRDRPGLPDIRTVAAACLATEPFQNGLVRFGHAGFDAALAAELAGLPPLEHTCDTKHEVHVWRALRRLSGGDAVAAAMRLLVLLIARHGTAGACYAPADLKPEELLGYPLNLDSLGRLARQHWPGRLAADWLGQLVVLVLSTHQRVAIRKLGQSGDDTLMFRHAEDGIVIERMMDEVVETQPRLNQAFQILRDLGLTVPSADGCLPVLTGSGRQWLGVIARG